MSDQVENHFYHICTDGDSIPWMFRDEKDFIAGVNRIGICYLLTEVTILAYVLMDNHVHFVLYGNILQCKKFINLYKNLTGRWIKIRYGISDYLRLLPTEIIMIESEENLLNTIAYIDRNAAVAGYRYMVNEYPWGSARYMFKDNRYMIKDEYYMSGNISDMPSEDKLLMGCNKFTTARKYRLISSFSFRERRQLLKSNVIFPDNWTVDSNGMIVPTLFLDFRKTESYFKSSSRYSFYLTRKLEGLINKQLESAQKVFLPDKEMRAIVSKIASQKYGTATVRELDISARLYIARQLRYSYAATVKQISRMLHLNKSALEEFI